MCRAIQGHAAAHMVVPFHQAERQVAIAYEPGRCGPFRRIAVEIEAGTGYVVVLDGAPVGGYARISDALARAREVEATLSRPGMAP